MVFHLRIQPACALPYDPQNVSSFFSLTMHFGFPAPSLPTGSWWASTSAPSRSSTARSCACSTSGASPRSSGTARCGARRRWGKSQSFAPRGSAGRDTGTKHVPLRDLFCDLRSIAFFTGSTSCLSSPDLRKRPSCGEARREGDGRSESAYCPRPSRGRAGEGGTRCGIEEPRPPYLLCRVC